MIGWYGDDGGAVCLCCGIQQSMYITTTSYKTYVLQRTISTSCYNMLHNLQQRWQKGGGIIPLVIPLACFY